MYNLETSASSFIANGIVTHNCRCYTIPAASELSKQLSAKGRITEGVLGVIQSNGPRILHEELTYALKKLKEAYGV